MSFSNFQTYMNRLYESKDDEITVENVDVAEVEVDTEALEEVVPKVSKSKKTTNATK